MSNNLRPSSSRRKFLGTAASLATGVTLAPSLIGAPRILKHYRPPNSLIDNVQIGVITYSFRSMPDQSAEATLQYVKDAGVSAIELMGEPAESFAGLVENPVDRRAYYQLRGAQQRGEALSEDQQKELADLEAQMQSHNKQAAAWRANASMDKFVQMKKMYNDAGVSIYAFKPRAFGKDNTDAEIAYGMRAAKALGANQVTLEHPGDNNQTLRLGKIAKKHKIYVGYHGHEQQTPTFWDTALKQSEYNAMNLDFGHFVAAGNEDPIGQVEAKHDRIVSMHLKDRQTPVHGKSNLLWGQGDTPIAEVLQLMRKEKYAFPATIELEYDIPSGSDAVKEVAKCLEYCRKALV